MAIINELVETENSVRHFVVVQQSITAADNVFMLKDTSKSSRDSDMF